MLTQLRCLFLLCMVALVSPKPGRVPKVYNALITSNQNLEPSKAYPVYQPVIHDAAFTFPLQSPFFYSGDFPLVNTFIHAPAFLTKQSNVEPEAPAQPTSPSSEAPEVKITSTTEQPATTTSSSTPETESESPKKLPTAPSTTPPILLNEFGLPPQVLPISRTFNSIPNIGHFTYPSPSIRFYDPFDPFGFHPYVGAYPLINVLGQYDAPQSAKQEVTTTEANAANQPTSTPPPEPSDLNVLNYSPKDPEIANVPPPPLPQGGLKADDKSQ